jgi:hypothetical protein
MDQELQSYGKCFFCNVLLKQNETGKHLAQHLAAMEKEDQSKTTKGYHHIIVEAGEMFLHILADGKSQMKVIDNFLRKIWLECCGHLSNFGHKNFKISMSNTVADVFVPKVKIYHDYDYGSTTRVELKAGKVYSLHLKEPLVLLSRNEPLKLICGNCKKQPAVSLCSVCMYEGNTFFCAKCSLVHSNTCNDFADYANMPVVNSPRMGVCGYEGGIIDKDRDGVYKSK